MGFDLDLICRMLPKKRASSTGQPVVDGLESAKSRAMAAEEQLQTTACFDQSSSQIHQLLDDCPDLSPLCGMPHGSHLTQEPQLADGSQDIVGEPSKGEDQGVGLKFSRW